MKPYHLICSLTLLTAACIRTTNVTEEISDSLFLTEKLDRTEPKTHIMSDPSLLFPVIYGALSGYLCRVFERNLLCDVVPFRLINLFIWSHIERSIMKDYTNSLTEQAVPYNAFATIYCARATSWLSYLLA